MPRRSTGPACALPRSAEETRIWATFRAFKAGITGEKGETLVAAALAELGVPALNDAILRDRRGLTQIDHIARAPAAIVVLETKHYSGIIDGEADGRAWTQRFERSPERFVLPNPLLQNHRHRLAVRALIADRAVLVRAHVVTASTARFTDELRKAVVPLAELAGLLAGDASAPQRWLDAAWLKLQAAAEASPALREAHRRDLAGRRP